MTEQTLEQQCVKFASNVGIMSARLDVHVDVGFPQRMFLIPGGRPLFVLFNQPDDDDNPKEKQERRLELDFLRKNSYNVIECDSLKCFLERLRLSLEPARFFEKTKPVEVDKNPV